MNVRTIAVAVGMMVCAGSPFLAAAEPFKLLDPLSPVVTTGVFDDLKGHSDGGGALAIITHKGAGVVEWTPLAIGGTLGRGLGGPSLSLGMSANLLPSVKAGALAAVVALFPSPDKFANLKKILSPPASGEAPDVTMSFGPNVSYVFYDGLKGKMVPTLFYGAQWKW